MKNKYLKFGSIAIFTAIVSSSFSGCMGANPQYDKAIEVTYKKVDYKDGTIIIVKNAVDAHAKFAGPYGSQKWYDPKSMQYCEDRGFVYNDERSKKAMEVESKPFPPVNTMFVPQPRLEAGATIKVFEHPTNKNKLCMEMDYLNSTRTKRDMNHCPLRNVIINSSSIPIAY